MTQQQQSPRAALRRRCEQIAVDLSAYIDGELQGEEFTRPRCRVEAHLEACPECRAQADEWGGVVDILAVPEVPDRPWFAAEFRRRLEAEESKRESRLGWIGMRLVPVAVAVLGLALGVWVRFELDRDRVSENLVERILRIQDLEASTLASTPVIAESDRGRNGFDPDELLISSSSVETSNNVSSQIGENADTDSAARLEKDR